MNLNESTHPQSITQAATRSVGKYRWTICALLFFATTVNYLDRQVLSLLAPDLSTQFGWSNTDYANIASVFQFVYAIAMVFAGRVVDKIGTKTAYIVAIGVWSTGAVMHAFAVPLGQGIGAITTALGFAAIPVSIAGFMLSRAVLAIGEAGNFPIAIKATAELIEKGIPTFGICLGHQIMALASGAKTMKMKFGHHGANHPVKDLTTGKVEIVSMNHGFTVDPDTLPAGVQQSHVSLFDRTNCGLAVDGKPIISVQHHPEASPGPQDSYYIFARFVDLMKSSAH